ncbi:MAG TPA: 7-carboxy-7-deazaguanine synthase QueE [Anaerohalosphaeraceae bacterium]|nr:7-carboxy-7-deazaguanine synthase QueE [Phycisphaerae bacterium]HOK95685.1 7-carboxy-7-deazaguanine synthase QueE [Anaerohalosphaeraceae bacterium]HOL32248.1 7-carboxy-7-deazaguanine synthase QueE [Anaerohalosphaeraceae bacterium]HOM76300.1 7-carboxy-7-deazaguanine synthase QueE [Anaerohalosphaeraceae bacterium]HPC64490.1 7-carboxy-7-deazaguanine synthase QueE [Anaerohalosphaeraceae bacterium]
MIVNELFYSLQGEGLLAGVPSVFVRLAGCPLRCRWCDTKYAWNADAGQSMTAEQILEHIACYPTRYVVLTGGEPLMHEGIFDLIRAIHRKAYHLTVETAGIISPAELPIDLMSISPKLSNTIADGTQSPPANPETVMRLIASYPYQLKFVVDDPKDLDEIACFVNKLAAVDPYKIYLMPQAANTADYLEKSRWLAEYCLQTGFLFSPRLHIMLWNGRRGR